MATGFSKQATAAPAIPVFGLIGGASAQAQVTTDGSVGPRVELGGPEFEIGADLGRQAGHNLFHSFERFSLATGERATFSGPDQIRNVISRVTGGERSDIDGTIRSTIADADFYFINPAGIIFGPNARLDVKGSFHVSTADELRFADDAKFSATSPAASSFTIARPEAFGFLGPSPSPILVDRSTLEVPRSEAFSIVGGDLTIRGDPNAERPGGPGAVRAQGGNITLTAAAGPGGLDIANGALTADRQADITLRDRALVDASGDGGGVIRIRGGSLVAEDQSFVFADNDGATNSRGGIDVRAEVVRVVGASVLSADAFGSGAAGSVAVHAREVQLRDNGILQSLSRAQGNGGAVVVTATDELIIDAAGANLRKLTGIAAGTEREASGDGGRVVVHAGTLSVLNNGVITSDTSAVGDAGPVTVTASDLEIRNGGVISSSTFDQGNADSVTIVVPGRLSMDQAGGTFTGITSQATPSSTGGDAGTVTVTAGTLTTRNGEISSSTFGPGDAGMVRVTADRLKILRGGQIASGTFGDRTGASGEVVVTAGEMLLISGRDALGFPSGIRASAEGAADNDQDAGNVTVRAGALLIDESGRISSSTLTAGDAGTVTVAVEQLALLQGGQISSSSLGESTGAGGDVRVTASDALIIAGENARGSPSGIFASAEGLTTATEDAGSVTVSAGVLRIRDGGVISSAAFNEGSAGSVTVSAERLLMDDARITTSSDSAGGGEIRLLVEELIDLHDSEVTTSVAGGADPTAGSILIDPKALVIDGSRIQANALVGFGGFVTLVADNIVVPGGDFEALLEREDISATGGDPTRDGTIAVNAPEINQAGDLVILQVPLLDAAALLGERCAVRRDVGASSFVAAGRGGLPASPDAPLPSPYRGAPSAARAEAGQGGAAFSAGAQPAMLVLAGCARAP